MDVFSRKKEEIRTSLQGVFPSRSCREILDRNFQTV
jgi:hypothetical protein